MLVRILDKDLVQTDAVKYVTYKKDTVQTKNEAGEEKLKSAYCITILMLDGTTYIYEDLTGSQKNKIYNALSPICTCNKKVAEEPIKEN